MARKVNVEDLVGAAEIAGRIGNIQPRTVHQWRTRFADFPEPVATLRQAMVWDWNDVAKWARKHERLS